MHHQYCHHCQGGWSLAGQHDHWTLSPPLPSPPPLPPGRQAGCTSSRGFKLVWLLYWESMQWLFCFQILLQTTAGAILYTVLGSTSINSAFELADQDIGGRTDHIVKFGPQNTSGIHCKNVWIQMIKRIIWSVLRIVRMNWFEVSSLQSILSFWLQGLLLLRQANITINHYQSTPSLLFGPCHN